MYTISLIHRWTGGIIGLLLAVLGLTGSLLVWKGAWLRLTVTGGDTPHAPSVENWANALVAIGQNGDAAMRYIAFPSDEFGLHKVATSRSAGYYANADGTVAATWASMSDRLELWVFDLHHHLLMGGAGETAVGVAGLVGLGFVITGTILWWRSKRSFRLSLWPKNMRRTNIIKHHRDVGVVAAPLLALIMLTGVIMALKPVGALILSPLSSPAEMTAALAPPIVEGPRAPFDYQTTDWHKIISTAHAAFPTADLRLISMPRGTSPLLRVRMKLPSEWLPNGRTQLWFDPATATLIDARSAQALPTGVKARNMVYPLHAAKVGGWIYKIAITLTGLILTILGSLAVWSFWKFEIKKPRKRRG
jgi:uncharacterized iron-regulated membrane protein